MVQLQERWFKSFSGVSGHRPVEQTAAMVSALALSGFSDGIAIG
jgi:hypothetical protein